MFVLCLSLTDFALCFDAPLPSSSPRSSRRSTPASTESGGSQEFLPMLSPGDTTLLNTSFLTPVFQTPPNGGPPPPYVQPKPQILSAISTPSSTGPPPTHVRPRLGRPLKTPPGPHMLPNQGGSSNGERPIGGASSSGSSFLTPGMYCIGINMTCISITV